MKAAFYTLGCKVNQNETEAVAGIFRAGGYQVVSFDEQADVYVINTCTVTNMGDRKSRQVIRRAVKANPQGIVVVMGCYAQTSPGEVSGIAGVDLVVGTQQRGKILELVDRIRSERRQLSVVDHVWQGAVFEELPAIESESRVRATLKIQEGCNQFCTYCIIPYARGPVRSRDPEKALAEAKKLIAAGYVELVVTGIHTGAYGVDLGVDLNFLLRRLAGLPGLKRLRLSSIEVTELSPALVETIVTHPTVCSHLHIPLQSGSDHTLSRMNRPYTTREFAEVVIQLRSRLPDLAVTTDVIVGFPGEDEADHRSSLEFARSMKFAGIHVFKYSPRSGTPAADYPEQVAASVKEARSKDFLQLAAASWREYAQGFLGRNLEILAEQAVGDGKWEGHTGNYLRVQFAAEGRELRGQMVQVKLNRLGKNFIIGSII